MRGTFRRTSSNTITYLFPGVFLLCELQEAAKELAEGQFGLERDDLAEAARRARARGVRVDAPAVRV